MIPPHRKCVATTVKYLVPFLLRRRVFLRCGVVVSELGVAELNCCGLQLEADNNVNYELTLYKDANYQHQLTSFPAAINDKQRLYVQASVTAGLLSSFHSFMRTDVSCNLVFV